MERESLLTVLIILLGGVTLQACALWPEGSASAASARDLERASWARLWRPLVPALVIAAALCGWALGEPDPVPVRVSLLVFVAFAPFAFIVLRAGARSAWSLLRPPAACGIATVGFIRPQIVFSPFLAKQLDDRVVRAALAHERAHVRYRDPLRIWLAQLVTDLQWPRRAAQRRFEVWLGALERARDEEARAEGIDGADIAAAILAATKFRERSDPRLPAAPLAGGHREIRERIAWLLEPLPQSLEAPRAPGRRIALLASALLLAMGLGVAFGERLLAPLLSVSL